MELTSDELAQLEAYWENRLSEQERASIKKRLEEDPPFKEAADHLFETRLTLREIQVRSWIKDVDIETEKRPLVGWDVFIPKLRVVKIAASVAGLLGLGYLAFYITRFTDPAESFVQTEFKAPPSRETVLAPPDKSRIAMDLYDKKYYDKAIPLLRSAFEANPEDSIKLYYVSVCLIAEGKPYEAIEILEEMQYSAKAKDPQWYLALAYLQQKNYGRAREYLNLSLKSNSQKIRERAQRGIEMLNKNNL